jgi:PAS domain S-box-containing protein
MKSILTKAIFSLSIFLIISTQALSNDKPKILIIHSYHPTLKWTKDLNNGIHSIFTDITKADLYTEYMDTKHHSSKEYMESLTTVYQKKYENIKFDVIISSDDNAFNFLKLHSKELFQDTPVVFSGVNDFQDEWIANHENFTGVSETVSYTKNFTLMKKLQPELKNIYIITDETTTAKSDKKIILQSIKEPSNKEFKFTFISAKNLQSLLTTVIDLPKDSAILYSSYYQESTGKSLKYHTVLKQLSDISDTPIYIVVDQYLSHGTLGGYLKSGFLQGEKAAIMATLIIKGVKASDIPVLKDNQNQYLFDYNVIKKQDIDINLTPSDSLYINKPDTLLELYFKEIITIIILFIIMFSFIVILLIINKKRAKAEKLAKKQLIFQQNLIDNVNTPIYYKNTNREYIGCNKAFEELMEINQDNILNKTTKYLNDNETAKFIDDKDIEILDTLTSQEYEGIYKLKDGTHKDLIFNKNVFFEDEQVGGIVGSIFDITEIKSLNYDLNRLLSTFDTNVIASKIDIEGNISYISQAFIDISKYKKSELLGKNLNILGRGVTEDSVYDELWSTISKFKIWNGELINKNKKGELYTLQTIITPEYDKNGNFVNYTSISQDITAQKLIEKANKEIEVLNEDIVSTQREIIYKLGAVAEARSKETGRHVRRVAKFSEMFALFYGLSQKEAELLKMASPMHDIGKIAIPDAILNKPAKFTEEEFEIMKTHAKLGYDMLKDSNKEILKAAAIIAHEHQEKYDGSGYPQALKGEEIHIYGRITAIADVFDALGSPRVYKKAWEDEAVFKLLKEGSGKHFDPKLVDIFFKHIDDFLKVRDEMKDIV